MSVSKDYIAHGCEKLAQAFYTVTTWPGVEPALVRRSTNEPPSHHDAWPATEHHCFLTGTNLYCLVTEAHMCEPLVQSCCVKPTTC